jgi:hypothetical protein
MLDEQVTRFNSGRDHNTEHYRYAAFCAVLRGRNRIADEEVDRYVELTELDNDPGMAGASRADLIGCTAVTLEQLARIERRPSFQARFLTKRLAGRRIMAELETDVISDDLFSRSLDLGLGRCLVDHPATTPEQLVRLRDNGPNKAIRNLATVRLLRGVTADCGLQRRR